jgi:hypothetical protein
MATFDDVYERVNFADGEEHDFDDFNQISRAIDARVLDQIVRGLTGSAGSEGDYEIFLDDGDDAGEIFVLRGGQGFIFADPTGLGISIYPGTVFQRIASRDGLDAKFLPFTFETGGPVGTLAAADPTNPRNDLVQIKLALIDDATTLRHFKEATSGLPSSAPTVPRRRVRATVSVKTGTPGVTPTIPTPDAGFVRWAVVRVPAGATDLEQSDVHPFQMPLQVGCYNVPPYAIGRPGTPHWVISTGARVSIAKNAGTDPCYAFCPYGFHAGRIVGVGLHAAIAVGSELISIVDYQHNAGALSDTELLDLTTPLYDDMAAGRLYAQTVGGALYDKNGYPIWTNVIGPQNRIMASAGGLSAALSAGHHEAALKINGDVLSEVFGVKFFVAS